VGAQEQLTRVANWRSPKTKYKRSKVDFSVTIIVFTLATLDTKFLELITQSLIGSPGTLAGSQYPGTYGKGCVKNGQIWQGVSLFLDRDIYAEK